MDYNIPTCTDCFQGHFDWQNPYRNYGLKSHSSPWLFANSTQDEPKFDEINFPWGLKDYPMNMAMEEYGFMYPADHWNSDYSYRDKSKINTMKKLMIDPNQDCFSSESDEMCRHNPPTANHHSLNIKSENLLIPLKQSTNYSDISSIVDCKDEIPPVPEQHLTFTSPESAFYDYQQKMENQLCQVCRESAAGFHHGAYVCEACKKFFMRHNLNCAKFTIPCPTGGQCAQLKTGRIKCQSCRFKKCIAIGMAFQSPNGSNSKFDISKIPCRVCGGKSSGFHFGALTCEGCKGFFRRTESTNQQLVCITGYNDCSLTGSSSRNLCKSCRFKRCIEVGMSKKGSRIGRQPNAVKFHCVLEIMQRSQDSKFSNDEITSDCSNQKSVFLRTYRKLHPPNQPKPNNKTNENNLEKFKERILDSMDNSLFNSNEDRFIFENSIKEATKIVDISKVNLQEFGNRRYSVKGLPLNELWSYMMNYFDVHSAMIVQFVKAIPGFNKFDLKYRRFLVQDAMYPIMLLKLAEDYKADIDEYNYFDFSISDKNIILSNFELFHKVTDHLLTVSHMVYSLQLSKYSISLMCVVELMKNFHLLSNPSEGKLILNQAKSLLWHHLENEDNYEMRKSNFETTSKNSAITLIPRKSFSWFQTIFEDLPKILSDMNLEHLKIIQELKTKHPELVFPELYIDMFNIHEMVPHSLSKDLLKLE